MRLYQLFDHDYEYPCPYTFDSNLKLYVRYPHHKTHLDSTPKDPNVEFPEFITKAIYIKDVKDI